MVSPLTTRRSLRSNPGSPRSVATESLAPAPANLDQDKGPKHFLGVMSHSTFVYLSPLLLIAAGALHAIIQEQIMHELGHLPLLITSFEFGCCSVSLLAAAAAAQLLQQSFMPPLIKPRARLAFFSQLLSLLMLLAQRENPSNAPRFSLLQISLLVLCSLVSGNVALKWVSYPVKVCHL